MRLKYPSISTKFLHQCFDPNWRFVCLWIGGLLLGAGCGAFQAEEAPVVDASQLGQQALSLTRFLAVLEDPGQALTLADVQSAEMASQFKSEQPASAALNYGYSQSAYWLRLTLRNPGTSALERLLEIASAPLSTVDFYPPGASGLAQATLTGMTRPFAARTHASRYYVFALTLPAHSEQVVYVRIASTNPSVIPARLWTPQAFQHHERDDYAVQALYFGMVMAMVLFNLLLFIALRDGVYLLYVCFVTSLALGIASNQGLGKEFLWPDATLWANIAASVCYLLAASSLIFFFRYAVNPRAIIPGFDRFLKRFSLLLLLIPIGCAVNYPVFIKVVAAALLFGVLLIFGSSLYCTYKKQHSARFFVAAYTVLLSASVLVVLRNSGWLASNVITENALQFGSALEMLLLSFALADRFNVIRQEKMQAQKAMLESQQRLVETLKTSERVLEEHVMQRTEELQQLNHKLENLSNSDGLTGIANRRRFDDVLASEWLRAGRTGSPLAVAMLDVDWFKKFNDLYGHPAGDACLRQVAQCLSAQVCRTGDLVARYGGEEFVFIAPATDGEAAQGLAERVRTALQALSLPHALSDFGVVTISVGVAVTIPEHSGKCTDAAALLQQADEALYRAKATGRNQSVLISKITPPTPEPAATA